VKLRGPVLDAFVGDAVVVVEGAALGAGAAEQAVRTASRLPTTSARRFGTAAG
jgi:hypothetical protein